MTPTTVSTPAFTNISDAIDSVPVIGETPSTTETTETTGSEVPPEIDTPAAEETPEGTEEQVAQPDQHADEDLDPADPLDPDKITPDGKQYFFRAAKAKQLLAARDFKNAIVAELGPDASIETVKELAKRNLGLDRFLADYDDPQRVGTAVDALFGELGNSQHMGMFADHLMAKVSAESPREYKQISDKVLGGFCENLYQQAQRTGNEQLLKLAQNLDFQLTRKFRSTEQIQQRDPYADQAADLARREQQYNMRVQQDRQQSIERQMQDAETAVESARSEEIAKAIPAAVRTALEALPDGKTKLKLITVALNTSVEDAVKANPIWAQKYDLAVRRFQQNPTAESRESLVTMMRQFVANVTAKERKAVIDAISGEALSKNAAAHAKQQQLAARQEPVGASAAPPRKDGFSQKLAELKKAGGTARDAMDLYFGQ